MAEAPQHVRVPFEYTSGASYCSASGRKLVLTLFDQGYVTVTPNFEVRVSSRLRDEFHNGKHYYRFEGRAIWLPKTEAERPNREFLEWHGDSVFRG